MLDHTHQPDALSGRPVRALRLILLLILLMSLIGTAAELVLLDHMEDSWQWIPLILIGLSMLALAFHALTRGGIAVRLVQLCMVLMIVSGGIGMFLHHRAKEEFKLEMQPELRGMQLFWEAMKGSTPPSLAPAGMIQLGLLGLGWSYRHPSLTKKRKTENEPEPLHTGA